MIRLKGFGKYVTRKLFWYLLTLIVALFLNFFLPRLIPGNPVDVLLSELTSGMNDTAQAQAMKDSMPVIMDVAKKFYDMTGRKYGFFEEYKMDDAEVAIVVIGSSAGTGKEAVDRLRAEGQKVGLIKLRVFRPFPRIPLAEAMCKVKAVAVMDRAESFSNSGGPLFNECRSSLYDLDNKPYCINYIYGLGGRDIQVEDFYEIYKDLFVIYENDDPGDVYRYMGVRDSRFL